MTAITVSGNATKGALASSPDAAEVLKRNIERQILAKESGLNSDGVFGIDFDSPVDERIVWADESNDDGITMTGTLHDHMKHMRKVEHTVNGNSSVYWEWTGGCDADAPERKIRIPDHLWDVAHKFAKQRGVNVGDVIRRSLAEWVDAEPDD